MSDEKDRWVWPWLWFSFCNVFAWPMPVSWSHCFSSFCILSACSRGQDVEPSLINHSVANYCVFPGSQASQAGHSGDAMVFCESFQTPWEGLACPYVPSVQPSVSFLSWSLKITKLLYVPFSQQTSLCINYVRKDRQGVVRKNFFWGKTLLGRVYKNFLHAKTFTQELVFHSAFLLPRETENYFSFRIYTHLCAHMCT